LSLLGIFFFIGVVVGSVLHEYLGVYAFLIPAGIIGPCGIAYTYWRLRIYRLRSRQSRTSIKMSTVHPLSTEPNSLP
jgi:hypothetical protein